MTMISEFGDGSAAAPMVPVWCPGYRSRSSLAGSDFKSADSAGEATYSPGPGRCAIPGGTGAPGPAAATLTRSIAWLPNSSVPGSHHSPPDAEAGRDACAEVSSHAPRPVWACSPLTSSQSSQQQADAEGDGGRGDEDAQRGFTSASERQAQAEPDHPATVAVVVTRPSRTMTSRSA